MKDPKVGERVAVYVCRDRILGKITRINRDGLLYVSKDKCSLPEALLHPKQCHRLKKKKKERLRIQVAFGEGYHQRIYIKMPFKWSDVDNKIIDFIAVRKKPKK